MASITRVPKTGPAAKGTRVKWIVRWRPPDVVNPLQRTFYSETPAKNFRADVEGNGEVEPEPVSPRPGVRTFRRVAEEYLDSLGAYPQTIAKYRANLATHVYPVFGDVDIADVAVHHVQSYVNRMRDLPRTPKTIRNVHCGVVVPVFDHAVRYGYRPRHNFQVRSRRWGPRSDDLAGAIIVPPSRGRTVTRDTVLLPAEAGAFLAAAYNVKTLPVDATGALDFGQGITDLAAVTPDMDVDTGDLVAALYLTGARWGEIVPLLPTDLYVRDDGTPVVDIAKVARRNEINDLVIDDDEGKSVNAFRQVLLSPYAEALFARRCAGRSDDDRIFTSPRGHLLRHNHWHTRCWTPVVTRAAARGYTKKLTPHKLRHGYATALIDLGAKLDFVSAQLGHASVVITQAVYVHITAQRADEGRVLIDQAFAVKPRQRLRLVSPNADDTAALEPVRLTAVPE